MRDDSGPELNVYARSPLRPDSDVATPLLESLEAHDRKYDPFTLLAVVDTARALGLDTSDPDIASKVMNVASDRFDTRVAREKLEDDVLGRYQEQSLVYYVRLHGERIKIGTTINLKSRLIGLRVDADAVLATEPGSYELENMRHRQFAHLRVGRREDFVIGDDLLSHIAMIVKHFGAPTLTSYLSRV